MINVVSITNSIHSREKVFNYLQIMNGVELITRYFDEKEINVHELKIEFQSMSENDRIEYAMMVCGRYMFRLFELYIDAV